MTILSKPARPRQAEIAKLSPVHCSVRRAGRMTPNNMSKIRISHETSEYLAAAALSIFADCTNAGLSFQDSVLAIYLSGLNHGFEAQKERASE